MGTVQTPSLTEKRELPSLIRLIVRHRLVLLVVAVALALDQITKYLVSHTMDLGQSVPAEGFFRITYVYNTGSIFGLFTSQNTILTLGSFVGVGVLFWFYRAYADGVPLIRISLGLLMAGALGNLSDRLILGRVTDFIDVGRWPIFNVADSSIVIGMVVLLWVFTTTPSVRSRELPWDEVASPFPVPQDQMTSDDNVRS